MELGIWVFLDFYVNLVRIPKVLLGHHVLRELEPSVMIIWYISNQKVGILNFLQMLTQLSFYVTWCLFLMRGLWSLMIFHCHHGLFFRSLFLLRIFRSRFLILLGCFLHCMLIFSSFWSQIFNILRNIT